MTIGLTPLEIVALQKVKNNPGVMLSFNYSEMATFGLVEEFEKGFRITNGGLLVLNMHLPFLGCNQRMSEPLGFRLYSKLKK